MKICQVDWRIEIKKEQLQKLYAVQRDDLKHVIMTSALESQIWIPQELDKLDGIN